MADETDLAATPSPPYTAVIFRTVRSGDTEGYAAMAESMERLAAEQPGYLGIESSADHRTGITVSYWNSHKDARAWKAVAEHLAAQREGIDRWYADYSVRIATVEREYRHPQSRSASTRHSGPNAEGPS